MTVVRNTSRRRIRNLVVAGAVSVMMAGSAAAETLAGAMASAYNHSGLLDQNRALLRAADEDVAIAMSALRPTLSWAAEASRNFGFNDIPTGRVPIGTTELSLSLIASYTLVDNGKRQYDIEAAKESVLATREALISIEQQVLYGAVSAFLSVRRNLEIVALRQNNVRVIQQELRAARDRFEVGEVTRTDVALAEARLAAARSSLAASQGDLEIARAQYTAVVGHKPGQLTPPRSLPRLPSQRDGAAQALRQHPDLRQVQHTIRALEMNLESAKTAKKPTVSLSGRLTGANNLTTDTYSRSGAVTLGAEGPIYMGGRLSALERQVRARRDAQRGNLHAVRHGVTQDVSTAYARFKVAVASIEASERQVRAARVAFRGVREEASLGARTTFDVLEAEQELLDAQAGLISANIDRHLAAYGVLVSLGVLTTEHLKLNVVRYDPAEYYNLVKDAPTATSRQGRQLDRVLKRLQSD